MCRRPAYWHDVTAFVTGQPLTARAAGCVHAPFAPPPRFDAPPAPIVRASSGLNCASVRVFSTSGRVSQPRRA